MKFYYKINSIPNISISNDADVFVSKADIFFKNINKLSGELNKLSGEFKEKNAVEDEEYKKNRKNRKSHSDNDSCSSIFYAGNSIGCIDSGC